MRPRQIQWGVTLRLGWARSPVVELEEPAPAPPPPAPEPAPPSPDPESPGESPCDAGPLDLVFVLDVTGSMGGAIENVQAGVADIIAAVVATSSGDYRLGLVRFEDSIDVLDDLALGNAESVRAHLLAEDFWQGGGSGKPEASDEALNTVLNRLRVADRPPGFPTMIDDRGRVRELGDYYQLGDFTQAFRAEASRIVVLVTDAPPAGFTDVVSPATIAHAHAMAVRAAELGVRIAAVFVPTEGDYAGQRAVMLDYAVTSGGVMWETAADASDLAGAIIDIINARACGE